jgi:hypothetical protein
MIGDRDVCDVGQRGLLVRPDGRVAKKTGNENERMTSRGHRAMFKAVTARVNRLSGAAADASVG